MPKILISLNKLVYLKYFLFVNVERILDKNLADLVRGIRNNNENEVC